MKLKLRKHKDDSDMIEMLYRDHLYPDRLYMAGAFHIDVLFAEKPLYEAVRDKGEVDVELSLSE